MIRVLHILDNMGMGGIQSFVLNLYRSIDQKNIQYDFLLHRKLNNDNEAEIKRLGGNIYFVPTRREGIKENKKALIKFFKEHKDYDAVHLHISSLTYIEPIIAAKKVNVPVRVIHSHSSKAPKTSKVHRILHELNKRQIQRYATHFFACSDIAAQWFYGGTRISSKATVIPNGLKCDEYAYNTEIREKYRKEFGLENKVVIGHVGRFHYAKNHEFIIEIFKSYSEVDDNAILMLVGDGETKKSIEKLVDDYSLTDKVFFLGNRSDIKNLLQVFDLFLLPSRYEGFPVTMVEAQAASLPGVVSDTITTTVDITGKVRFCSLNDSHDVWIKNIGELLSLERDISDLDKVKKAGFDVGDVVSYLERVYSGEK